MSYPSKVAEIWTAVPCKPRKVRGVFVGRKRGLGPGLDVVSPVELSQGEMREPDLGEMIVESWRVVPRNTTFSSQLDLLRWRLLLRKAVGALSLSILWPRHERPWCSSRVRIVSASDFQAASPFVRRTRQEIGRQWRWRCAGGVRGPRILGSLIGKMIFRNRSDVIFRLVLFRTCPFKTIVHKMKVWELIWLRGHIAYKDDLRTFLLTTDTVSTARSAKAASASSTQVYQPQRTFTVNWGSRQGRDRSSVGRGSRHQAHTCWRQVRRPGARD